MAQSFYRTLGPLGASTGLIPDRLQLGDAILQHQVGEIGDAAFDGVVEPLEFGVCLSHPLALIGRLTWLLAELRQ